MVAVGVHLGHIIQAEVLGERGAEGNGKGQDSDSELIWMSFRIWAGEHCLADCDSYGDLGHT